MFKSPASIAFSISSIDVHWYGIIMAISILVGLFVVLFIRKKFYEDITEEKIFDISFLLIIFGIFSARAYYVLLDYKYFLAHPFYIPCIWNGGISIQGAILGGIIIFYIYSKENNLNFLRYADLFSFGAVSGQIIGRWGNFFNSEAFGLPCNLPWKLYIPFNMRPFEYRNYEFFHPTFLYESLLNGCILLFMLFVLYKKQNRANGTIFFLYIALYSCVRFFVESLRVDSVLNISGLHAAHIASILFFVFAVCGLSYINKKQS